MTKRKQLIFYGFLVSQKLEIINVLVWIINITSVPYNFNCNIYLEARIQICARSVLL